MAPREVRDGENFRFWFFPSLFFFFFRGYLPTKQSDKWAKR